MAIDSIELRRVRVPLVRPFRTSFGTESERDVLLVRARSTDGVDGWGECGAMSWPGYSPEFVGVDVSVIVDYLLPRLVPDARADEVAGLFAPVQGYPMAKAAVEAAILDLELREAGESWAHRLGGTHAVRDRVDCGVSVGIPVDESIEALLTEVAGYVAGGYRRIKLKIEPGFDIEAVRAVRSAWPDVPLQVDANQAYGRADAAHLSRLDAFGLLLIEQPLPEDDVVGHRALADAIDTPVCLDESIVSLASAESAIALGAAEVINIKPGRVGGYLEAVRIHDLCLSLGIPVWCGGMLETGIARAANVTLAALPGFTLPGDTSGSSRYFARDLTEPFVLEDGTLGVPQGPGLSRAPDRAALEAATTWVQEIALTR